MDDLRNAASIVKKLTDEDIQVFDSAMGVAERKWGEKQKRMRLAFLAATWPSVEAALAKL